MAETHSPPRLVLIDAMALIFRAHFVFIKNPRVTSTGINTSAVYGFANSLMEVLNSHKPTHLGVAFESRVPTLREEAYPAYKANREEAPEDIRAAVPMVMELLKALRIPCLELDRYEADDVIGSLAWQAAARGIDCYMLTPDKDYAQLVKPHVYLLRPSSKFAPQELLDAAGVQQKFGVAPTQIADLLGLKGDSIDNIPGIPKIGEKTALSLLETYGTLEKVIAHAGEIDKKSVRETIQAHAEQGRMSKQLATIYTDAPIALDLDSLVLEAPDKEALEVLLHKWEFRTLAQRLLGGAPANGKAGLPQAPDLFSTPAGPDTTPADSDSPDQVEGPSLYRSLADTPHHYELVAGRAEIEKLVAEARRQPAICFDTETTGLDALQAQVVGLALSWQAGTGYYIPFPEDQEAAQEQWEWIRPLMEDQQVMKVAQNLKYDLTILGNYGIGLKGELYDTMLAHYVAHSHLRHGMDLLATTYLNYAPMPITSLIGKKGKGQLSMRQVPVDQVAEYAAEDADITWQLYQQLAPEVEAAGLNPVLQQVELPLLPVLARMERTGITVDVPFLEDYSAELKQELRSLEAQIYDLSGETFNINSPRQLGEVLFEKLQLAKPKKTRTGQYSTDEEVLSSLAAMGYELPDRVLDYRELTKLKSTYVDAIPQLVNPLTGRVHTSYNQAVAVTGRLSSNNPNLQNIPIRTARGREVRKAFVAADGQHLLLSADYSQIELRIMAAMSGDQHLLAAFRDGADIHTATAARVFGVDPGAVDREMRGKAKMVNFGIIYGITAYGLSQRLGISRAEAAHIIESYFAQYPGVKAYMEDCVARARHTGYAYTLMGRRHLLRDIDSRNATVRGFAERNAINTPIQGTAADMIKLAMIRTQAALDQAGLRALLLLQVHDELVLEVHQDDLEALKPLVTEAMQAAMPSLAVPIVVEIGAGPNWLDAH
ncbi:MAG: DNA polymerase I [Sphingobacteriia bacterium]